jgi:hypothetical protein
MDYIAESRRFKPDYFICMRLIYWKLILITLTLALVIMQVVTILMKNWFR